MMRTTKTKTEMVERMVLSILLGQLFFDSIDFI